MMDLQPSDGGGGNVPFVHVISAFFGTDKVLGTKGQQFGLSGKHCG